MTAICGFLTSETKLQEPLPPHHPIERWSMRICSYRLSPFFGQRKFSWKSTNFWTSPSRLGWSFGRFEQGLPDVWALESWRILCQLSSSNIHNTWSSSIRYLASLPFPSVKVDRSSAKRSPISSWISVALASSSNRRAVLFPLSFVGISRSRCALIYGTYNRINSLRGAGRRRTM